MKQKRSCEKGVKRYAEPVGNGREHATFVDHIVARPRGLTVPCPADRLDNLRSLCVTHDAQIKRTAPTSAAGAVKSMETSFLANHGPRRNVRYPPFISWQAIGLTRLLQNGAAPIHGWVVLQCLR